MKDIFRIMKIEDLENELYNLYEDYRDNCISYEEYKKLDRQIKSELSALGYYRKH